MRAALRMSDSDVARLEHWLTKIDAGDISFFDDDGLATDDDVALARAIVALVNGTPSTSAAIQAGWPGSQRRKACEIRL